jgi:pilus assembly protein Flp/PilA
MAQIGENGLFKAGVAELQRGFHDASVKTTANAALSSTCSDCVYAILDCGRAILSCRQSSVEVGRTSPVKLKCMLAAFIADESGATAIEYGLIAAGIALAIIEVIYALGTDLVAKLQSLATALK